MSLRCDVFPDAGRSTNNGPQTLDKDRRAEAELCVAPSTNPGDAMPCKSKTRPILSVAAGGLVPNIKR